MDLFIKGSMDIKRKEDCKNTLKMHEIPLQQPHGQREVLYPLPSPSEALNPTCVIFCGNLLNQLPLNRVDL
jgi:hypothetical protein